MIQAISLAVAGSFYPVGLLFVLRYLSAGRDLFIASTYLVGGALDCLLVSIAELVLLNWPQFDQQGFDAERDRRHRRRGPLALIGALVARPRRHSEPEIETLTDLPPAAPKDPSPWRALLVGLVAHSNGLGLIAGIKALVDAHLSCRLRITGPAAVSSHGR